MNTSLNISWINKSNTDIYVQPQDKREYDNRFNRSTLNLTWAIDSYLNDTMKINVKFDYPLEISPNIKQDKLVIFFNQSQRFINCLWNDGQV